MKINDPEVIAQVQAQFERYERALMADDLAELDALFHDASTTVRFGVGEVLYGMDEIRAFRQGRGGSPQRRLGRVAIASFGDDVATANAEFFREGDHPRGRQSQTWIRFSDGWKIVAAHVSIEGRTS
jgi:hypothetical protein